MTEQPIKRFFSLLSLDKKDIIAICTYSVFGGIIGLSIPLGVQSIINLIAMGQTTTSWLVLTLLIGLATAIIGILKLQQFNIVERLQRKIFTRSSFEFAYRIPRLSIEKLKEQYAPELANRFFDTLALQKGLPKIVTDFADSILQIIFGLILLGLYHPIFGVFGIILIFLLLLLIWLTGKNGLKSSLMESKYKYKVAYWLEELGRVMSSFKLVGYTDYPLDKTNELTQSYLNYRQKHFSVLRWQLIGVMVLKTVATASLLLLGGLLVIDNQINIGQFVAAEIMVIMVLNSLEKIILSMETIFDVLTSIEKIGMVMDLELEPEKGIDFKSISQPKTGMRIKAENLFYQLNSQNTPFPIINNINLDIKAGEKIAITGFNGAGKTALLKILIGLYQNYNGTLCYNEVPQKGINLTSLRGLMGDYINDEHIFMASLYKNITLGRENVSLKDIMDTCNKIALTDFIQSLPEGLETILPPEGEGLPQSVIKKIILARCIVDNPLLVGVEPFLNGITDRDRNQIINVLTKGSWTLLAVTHLAQFAKRCDRIIVMDKGAIIFSGSFQELTKKDYARELFEDY